MSSLQRTSNDWAVWAFFMTNVSSFFCLNTLELHTKRTNERKVATSTNRLLHRFSFALYMCTLAPDRDCGNLYLLTICVCKIHKANSSFDFGMKCGDQKESVILASSSACQKTFQARLLLRFPKPSSNLLKRCRLLCNALRWSLFLGRIWTHTMCKSSWFCVSQLIEHIKMHRIIADIDMPSHNNVTLFTWQDWITHSIRWSKRWVFKKDGHLDGIHFIWQIVSIQKSSNFIIYDSLFEWNQIKTIDVKLSNRFDGCVCWCACRLKSCVNLCEANSQFKCGEQLKMVLLLRLFRKWSKQIVLEFVLLNHLVSSFAL